MNSTSASSDAGSDGGVDFAGVAGLAAVAGFGAMAGAGGLAAEAADAVDTTGFSVVTGAGGGATGGEGAGSFPAGTSVRATGAPGGSLCTRAVGVPIVSTLGAAGVTAAFGIVGAEAAVGSWAFAAGAADAAVTAATGAAVTVEPVTDFARATGVLSSPFVEAITAERAVTAFAGLDAGAPPSGFFAGTGLNESRIFSAAAQSWARICGI